MTAKCTCLWDEAHEHVILLEKSCPIHNRPGAVIPTKDVMSFPSGAVRGSDEIRYDLLPKEMLLRAISAFEEGEAKYGKNNYRKGIPTQNLANHCINHMLEYLRGDTSEDHIAHSLANLGMLCWMEANKNETTS